MLAVFAQRKEYSQMLIDLTRLPVLPQQPTQHPLSPHPKHLGGHTRLSGTLPLTRAGVATLALRGVEIARAGAGVDAGGLADDELILEELLDVCARVGVADLRLLSGVEPDLALADASDGRGEALLGAEVDYYSS